MRTLLDVLTEPVRELESDYPKHPVSAAERVIDAIPPETREALEVGLLLAEVERHIPDGWRWNGVDRSFGGWTTYLWGPVPETKCPCCGQFNHAKREHLRGAAPTFHAALTALLEQLPVPEPAA